MHNFHSINRTQCYAFNTKSQVLLSTAIMVMLTYFMVNRTPTPWPRLLYIILLLQDDDMIVSEYTSIFFKIPFLDTPHALENYSTQTNWLSLILHSLLWINQLVRGKVDLGSKQDPVLFVCDWTKNWHFPPVILKLIFKQWKKSTNKSKSNTWKVMFWLKFLNRE